MPESYIIRPAFNPGSQVATYLKRNGHTLSEEKFAYQCESGCGMIDWPSDDGPPPGVYDLIPRDWEVFNPISSYGDDRDRWLFLPDLIKYFHLINPSNPNDVLQSSAFEQSFFLGSGTISSFRLTFDVEKKNGFDYFDISFNTLASDPDGFTWGNLGFGYISDFNMTIGSTYHEAITLRIEEFPGSSVYSDLGPGSFASYSRHKKGRVTGYLDWDATSSTFSAEVTTPENVLTESISSVTFSPAESLSAHLSMGNAADASHGDSMPSDGILVHKLSLEVFA